MLTIAYMTNRRDCRIKWFFDSLKKEAGEAYDVIKIVVVDFYANERGSEYDKYKTSNVVWVEPKPTVWQGKYRLTSRDYFAPSNARNTAICHAEDGHIAFVDDLSVLVPGWLNGVRGAMQMDKVVMLGRYNKVKNLLVVDGQVVSFEEFSGGVDSRYDPSLGDAVRQVSGEWMYGASLVCPVESLLEVNGFDEDCDSMGSEDYICGMMLEANGNKILYNQGMRTFESEELHHKEKPFLRIIKPYVAGVSKFKDKDASHAILNLVKRGRKYAPNFFTLRQLRKEILRGGAFEVNQNPQHDWRDGQPLSEL